MTSKFDHDAYTWFESEFQTKISQIRTQRQYYNTMQPTYMARTVDADWSIPEFDSVPVMKVEILEPDLLHMIRDLRQAHAHETVQQRYPQLREAYLNYLSLVYLTVDKFPD